MPHPMIRASAVLMLLLSAVAAGASCIEQGHYAIVAHTGTLEGTAWPYSEDLASRYDQLPVGDPTVIAYDNRLPWTKLQTGCDKYGERNVFASETVHLVLRASFTFSNGSKQHAVTGARYQVQLRLNDRVVLDEVRRLDGRYPQSQRFGAVARNVPKGSHVYSMWFRLLDGPENNQVTIGLQWITSQGMPAEYPAFTATARGLQRAGAKWTPVGPPLTIETTTGSDFILLSTITSDARMMIGYSVDSESEEKQHVPRQAMIVRYTAFDQRLSLPAGRYVVRLWARSLDEEPVTLARVRTDVAAFPLGRFPMHQVTVDEPMIVTPTGSDDEPITLNPVCGRWTKLMEFDTPRVKGDFSWFLHAYVEFPRVIGHGYVEVAIQTVLNQPPRSPGMLGSTDMGIIVAQLSPGGDAVSFYGDASSWGNEDGNEMSLWIRIIEGCNGAPFGNELTVGKRSLAIKLLPTTSLHIP